MFSALIEKLANDLDALKRAISVHDSIRALISGDSAALAANPFLGGLVSSCPKKLEWQVIDHCAAVTRLYALYEQFVEAIVTSHVDLLPSVYPQYSKLPECVRKHHRTGVGQILQKWSVTSAYNHLTEPTIAAGLVDGLRGVSPYRLLADAFLIDVENYRPNALRKLFGYVDFADCVAYIHKHPSTTEFIQTKFGNSDTIEGILGQIVQLRNEAAHGSVSSVLSAAELCRYADLILVVCTTIAEMTERRALTLRINAGHCEELGKVIHKFRDSISGIHCESKKWQQGEVIAAMGDVSAKPVTVLSIRADNVPVAEVLPTSGQQIGVKLSEPLQVGTILYRIITPGPVTS
jgi:hypothetical protein